MQCGGCKTLIMIPNQPLEIPMLIVWLSLYLSVIRQTFGWGVTNARNNWKNHIMASLVSPSTIAKANGNMLRFRSWLIPVNKVAWYLPVKKVPSTWTMGLQLNPSIQGLKAQKTRSNTWQELSSRPSTTTGLVTYCTIVPGRLCYKAWNHLGR